MATRAAADRPPAATNYPVITDRAMLKAIEEYAVGKNQEKVLKKRLEALKPSIVAAMKGSPVAMAGSRMLTLSDVPEIPATPDVTITKSMVGQVIAGSNGRKGYQQLTVT